MSDAYLAQHIRDALAGDEIAELGIDVQVTPSGVFLSGTVASPEQCEEIVAVATREAGGAIVHDDLVVVDGPPITEPEVLA